MLKILKHRANSISDISDDFGVEIDVRDYNGEIVLSHDYPEKTSVKLSDYLSYVKKSSLIAINVKSSEIENDLKKIVMDSKIQDYFTFDWAIPSLLKAKKIGLKCAFRLSEYEKDIFPECSWVWIDAFQGIWYDEKVLQSLKQRELNIALVSPELHNRKEELLKVKQIVSTGVVDAICTDLPEYWLK